MSALTEHELMSQEMDRLRAERDALKKLVDAALMKELLAARSRILTLEGELSISEGKLAQAMQGIQPSEYSG